MLIEKLEELNSIVSPKIFGEKKQCILAVEDNKSQLNLQSIIVNHPLDFIRNLNEFSKNLRLPVSDMSILLIGYIGKDYVLEMIDDICEISPYVYFKRPEEVDVNVGSDAPVPPTEA